MEIILGQARRCWSEDEKRALVAEAFIDAETVNGVARRHNISRSILFGWRKQYREALNRAHITVAIPDLNRASCPNFSRVACSHTAHRVGVWT